MLTIAERLDAIKTEVETAGAEAAKRVEAAVAEHLPAIMGDDLMQSVEAAAGLPGWARTLLAGIVDQGCAALARHVASDGQPPAASPPAAPVPGVAAGVAGVPPAVHDDPAPATA
jgi:hypothetical protein